MRVRAVCLCSGLSHAVRGRARLPACTCCLSAAGAYSLECWGGATFDVSMRFLKEDPWDRLAAIRAAAPDVPLQVRRA